MKTIISKNPSLLWTLARTFFVLLCLLAAPGCREEQPSPVSAPEKKQEAPDQVFEGFEMALTENGINKGWVKAARAEKYLGKDLFLAQKLEVTFFTTSGQINSFLTSRRGVIHIRSGDMEAFDSVVVVTADSSRTLQTEHLIWKKSDNHIYSDSAVVIRGREGVLYGKGLKADAAFMDVEVKNPSGDIHVLDKNR